LDYNLKEICPPGPSELIPNVMIKSPLTPPDIDDPVLTVISPELPTTADWVLRLNSPLDRLELIPDEILTSPPEPVTEEPPIIFKVTKPAYCQDKKFT
jgi:hypothetical protein